MSVLISIKIEVLLVRSCIIFLSVTWRNPPLFVSPSPPPTPPPICWMGCQISRIVVACRPFYRVQYVLVSGGVGDLKNPPTVFTTHKLRKGENPPNVFTLYCKQSVCWGEFKIRQNNLSPTAPEKESRENPPTFFKAFGFGTVVPEKSAKCFHFIL